MSQNIAIIGAGIGGLTAALALQQKGCKVTVYEAAPEIKPVGAGIGIGNNAMQIFQALGIQSAIENVGTKVESMNITDQKLAPLSVMNLRHFEQKYGVHNVAIHRADLQKIIAQNVGFDHIKLDHQLTHIETVEGETILHFDHQPTQKARLVIAADGIKSVVRKQFFPEATIRQAHQWCWRGVCDTQLPDRYLGKAMEAWEKGKRFGFVKVSHQKLYWYAVVNENLVSNKTEWPLLFKNFHADVQKIIAETATKNIILHPILDLKPMRNWHYQNICLLGDAAHATTPNLGQGACQAIEDAYALAQLYHPEKNVTSIFDAYEKHRQKKAYQMTRKSWQVGKMAHLDNDFAVFWRNLSMKSMPKFMKDKQLDAIFNIDYLKNLK